MNEQARLSDQAQQADPQFSGEPPGFSAWALDHVRQLIGTDPSISRQISGRINELQTKLQRLDAERQRQQAAWDAEHAALVSRLEQLIALVP